MPVMDVTLVEAAVWAVAEVPAEAAGEVSAREGISKIERRCLICQDLMEQDRWVRAP